MRADYEYLLVDTEDVEEVIYSCNTLKGIAKFCDKDYSEIRKNHTEQNTFRFEGKRVKIVSVDMNKDYEVENG